jgi:nucleotide-binding universal stress UspA family protein
MARPRYIVLLLDFCVIRVTIAVGEKAALRRWMMSTVSEKVVLACVDGSQYMTSVCDHASWASRQLGQPVLLLHTQVEQHDFLVPNDFGSAVGMAVSAELLEKLTEMDEARSKLEQQKGRVVLVHAAEQVSAQGVTVSTRQEWGSLVDVLAELEPTASIVLIGKRGETAQHAANHLGSNLERVVRSAQVPVLVCARDFSPVERLIIAYDGGTSARKALEYIAQSPLFGGVAVHLIYVGTDNPETQGMLSEAAAVLTKAGRTAHTHIAAGAADQVITDYVVLHNIQLIVMGAYSHSPLRNFFVGSTTSAILQSAPVSVLLFR